MVLLLLLGGITGSSSSRRSELRSSPQDPVLLLEFRHSPFEVAELRFPAIARVLRCDPVAVCAGFLALLGEGGGFCWFGRVGGGGCACAFAGWLVFVVFVVVGGRR
jgi:hypothetical protein